MKAVKQIIAGAVLILWSITIHAQQDSSGRNHPLTLDFLKSTDFLNTSYGRHLGSIVKAKWTIASRKHLEWRVGGAARYSYLRETYNKFTRYVEGYTLDGGLYFVNELTVYPFQRKHFFLSVEPYAGGTHMMSKGTLKIGDDGQKTSFRHHYTYFDYGVSQSIGVRIRQFSITGGAWLSLKGILDGGRSRLADFDSRFLPYLGMSYSFR